MASTLHQQATVDFRDLDLRENPLATFAALRAEMPVCRIKGLRSHLVTRYSDCAAILSSDDFGFEEPSSTPARRSDYHSMRRELMLFQNAPSHPASRESAKNLLRKSQAEQRELLRTIARELISSLQAKKSPWDFIEDFARPYVWRTISRLLSLPESARDVFSRLTREIARTLDPLGPENSVTKAGELYREFESIVEKEFAACPFHKNSGTGEAIMLLAASLFTPSHMLGLVVADSLLNPTRSHLLEKQWKPGPAAVEELLRYHSPAQMTRRIALREVTLHGQTYPAGSTFWLSLLSANRDECEFPQPGELQLDRRPNRHLAFGKGAHFCLGAQLARLQTEVFLQEFSGSFPGLTLAGEPVFLQSLLFRGLDKLPVHHPH